MLAPMLVSVLMPVHDAAATLPLAWASIRRQRGVRFECVAVDDGSRDGSLELLSRWAREDARLRVLAQPHGGIVSALERGLAACRGELVARMDADDVMHGERLAAQVALLERRPELAGVGCHVRSFPRRALSSGRRAYERWLNSLSNERDVYRERFVECPLAHPTLTVRAGVLRRFGYRERGMPEDYDLVLRLCAAGLPLGVVPRRLHGWRDAPGRLSRRSPAYAAERFTALKAEFIARDWLGARERYVLWGYGDTGRSLCRELSAHGRRPAAIVEVHPGRIGQRIQGAPVVAPEALPRVRGSASDALPVVVSVAHPGPRADVRAALTALGLVELDDYVCAA